MIFLSAAAATHAQAPVPGLINYQGRVAVSGTPFTGNGLFKFALVNNNGTTTFWSNDGTSSAGSQPTAAVTVPVANGVYGITLGDTTVANMTTIAPSVFSTPDVRLRVWFNDGVNGFQLLTPDQRIASVGYAMVAASVPDGSITAAKLAPGVGGGTPPLGSITVAHLAPNAAAGNLAASGQLGVPTGGMIASYDPAAPALASAGYVRLSDVTTSDRWGRLANIQPSSLTDERSHVRPARRYDATAVWTGAEMIVWGGRDVWQGGDLPTGECFDPVTNSWKATSLFVMGEGGIGDVIYGRSGHTAVWTGTEMLIWGGDYQGGYRYNPATNTWAIIPETLPNTPSPRREHTAVWTGTHMIIWGGHGGGVAATDGARFNPVTNAWSTVNPGGAPIGRWGHTAIWTGTQMIIWGGFGGVETPGHLADGAIYTPSANAWTPLPAAPLAARSKHSAVWTGTKMVVFGGDSGTNMPPNEFAPLGDGAAYTLDTNSWSSISLTNAPLARFNHTALWTGSQMMIWGGNGNTSFEMNPLFADGGRYDPVANSWTAIPEGGPEPRTDHVAVWTGTEMIIAKGLSEELMPERPTQTLRDYWRFNPTSGTWIASVDANGLVPRAAHTAVWTGAEMLVWGGLNISFDFMMGTPVFERLASGARFNPALNTWSSISGSGAPSPRGAHTAVWTGTEMIVWGGGSQTNALGPIFAPPYDTYGDGARYNPVTNAWAPVASAGAPSARNHHTAVWTGNRMIVWGGSSFSVDLGVEQPKGDGASYNPGTDTWTAISAPELNPARTNHTAVWTGTEMLIWGGAAGEPNFEMRNDGSRYDPAANAWTEMAGVPFIFETGMPVEGRFGHTCVWTGTEMIVWGGMGAQTFARYNPELDRWSAHTSMVSMESDNGQVNPRSFATAVWTGSKMLVWGGSQDGTFPLSDGSAYDPVENAWVRLATSARPQGRVAHTAVWTGSQMIIFGGYGPEGSFDGGYYLSSGSTYGYSPAQTLYLYGKQP